MIKAWKPLPIPQFLNKDLANPQIQKKHLCGMCICNILIQEVCKNFMTFLDQHKIRRRIANCEEQFNGFWNVFIAIVLPGSPFFWCVSYPLPS